MKYLLCACRNWLLFSSAVLALLTSEVRAHGLGYTNGRLSMDPASISALLNKAVPGATPTDKISFIVYYDTANLSGPMG